MRSPRTFVTWVLLGAAFLLGTDAFAGIKSGCHCEAYRAYVSLAKSGIYVGQITGRVLVEGVVASSAPSSSDESKVFSHARSRQAVDFRSLIPRECQKTLLGQDALTNSGWKKEDKTVRIIHSPSEPASCHVLKTLLRYAGHIGDSCPQTPGAYEFVITKQEGPTTKMSIELKGMGRFGNGPYDLLTADYQASIPINARDGLNLGLGGAWRKDSGKDATRQAHANAQLDRRLTSHWMVFTRAGVEQDTSKNIDLRAENIVGLLYSLWDFADKDGDAKRYLAFSLGTGPRAEYTRADNTDRELKGDLPIKARIKFEKGDLAKQGFLKDTQFETELWYTFAGYVPQQGSSIQRRFFDLSDNQIDLKVTTEKKISDNWFGTVNTRLQRDSTPVGDAKKTDVEFTVGLKAAW